MAIERTKRPIKERLWGKINILGPDDCWEWKAYCNEDGYGTIQCEYKSIKVHRLVWELENGLIPEGMDVLHRCDNPPCCNPNHLFLGTRGDNNRDRARKGRSAIGEKSGRAVLTETQVREIRLLKGKFTQQEIANRYGAKRETVRSVLNGNSWKEVI